MLVLIYLTNVKMLVLVLKHILKCLNPCLLTCACDWSSISNINKLDECTCILMQWHTCTCIAWMYMYTDAVTCTCIAYKLDECTYIIPWWKHIPMQYSECCHQVNLSCHNVHVCRRRGSGLQEYIYMYYGLTL